MSRHSVFTRGARIAGGLAGVVVAVAVVTSAAVLPLPTARIEPPSALIRPQPTELQRVCAGGIVRLGAGGADATAASFLGAPEVLRGTTVGDQVRSRALEVPDVQASGPSGAPLVLTAPGSEDGESALGASESQTVNSGDLVGYSASACAEAGSESWLVAGSTVVGRTALILLSNPSDVTATVDLTIYGEQGPVSAPGADGIPLPAGSQRVIPLAGLAPNVMSPVVRVESRGGQVAAVLQQSIVRGLQPGGVEMTGPTAGPGLTQVIPGVRVAASVAPVPAVPTGQGTALPDAPAPPTGPDAVVPDAVVPPVEAPPGEQPPIEQPPIQPEESSGSDTETVLRLFAPGSKDAVVTVGVATEDGSLGGTSFELQVPAGAVLDVPFDELEDGLYTVSVESTQPVVASARSSTGGGAGGTAVDFAWFVAPVGPLIGDVLLAVPAGPDPLLHIHNPGEAATEVVLMPPGGDELSVEVPAESSTSVSVTAGTTYRLETTEPVVAAMTFLGTGVSSAFPVNPPNPSASPLRIYP